MRGTQKDLEAVCARINEITGSPSQPYIDKVRQAGNYHLHGAYGGWELHRYEPSGSRVIISGYQPKKELFNQMLAFISGLKC